ncbi:MAG: hypothetical protein RL748_1730 [Pseudomonadota bacterium]|jgi:methyltransferase-like protein
MPQSLSETNSYDQSPYESYPFFYTRPEHLRAVGIIFGMTPPALATARVLELGSAAGGSLLGFAALYPQSFSLGIDLSGVQIEQGQAQVAALGLQNLQLKAMSIMDIDDAFGHFDYIICHGVFSWVPAEVRDKIMAIAKNNLSQNGIAFISYNTLPGWNNMATVRELMQFHAAGFASIGDKVEQAKLCLNFVRDALADYDDPYSRFMQQEAANLQSKPESYLLHEYLHGENKPFYFHEFMQQAKARGLGYLGDTHLHSMYTGNLPAETNARLLEIGDIVRIEQYMDFIQNRRFRCSLLCHEHIPLNRTVTPSVMDKLYLNLPLTTPVRPEQIDLHDDSSMVPFQVTGVSGASINAGNALMKAVMFAFVGQAGREIAVDSLLQSVQSSLPGLAPAQLQHEVTSLLLTLLFKGILRVSAAPVPAVNTISATPCVSSLVRLQVQNPQARWVTTLANEALAIEPFERLALRYLDGQHSRSQIVALLAGEPVRSGELELKLDGVALSDPAIIEKIMAELLDAMLEKIRTRFVLIA